MTHLGFQKKVFPIRRQDNSTCSGVQGALRSATNTISASGSQHQTFFVPGSFLLCFCYPKEPVECWATAQPGKNLRALLRATPPTPGVWYLEHCRAGTVSPRGSHTEQLSWPHHSTHNLTVHSQELRKVCLFKKRIPVLTELPLLQEQTLLGVYLIDGQVVTLPINSPTQRVFLKSSLTVC